MTLVSTLLLNSYETLYSAARPLIFRGSAQHSHERAVEMMRWLDDRPLLVPALPAIRRLSIQRSPIKVGGVALPDPLILAAGWVKGDGFETEQAALDAVASGYNIIPGWRSMPALLGPVEFGSFTRWPRMGNSGTVLWRDAATRSTQNRIGLKNPGAEAAAEFLSCHNRELPIVWGVNIAISPSITDAAQEKREALEALGAFTQRGVIPSWFTLNLSCPNTRDDPGGNQSEAKARSLCSAIISHLTPFAVPLWVKIGPNLSQAQIAALMHAFGETGVRAVIATNTMPEPTPNDPSVRAGVAGGRLHAHAVEIACLAQHEIEKHGFPIDVIGSGGVDSGVAFAGFARHGIRAVQYLSTMIYRGPLAAALIEREIHRG
jgi:dihydroorotate dehydrogenase